MATWKLPLRRDGDLVFRWDFPTGSWVKFTEPYQSSASGMRGSYELLRRDGDISICRWTERKRPRYEQPVPQGISVWDYEQGGSYVLPWMQPDLYVRAVALLGIDPNVLHVQSPETLEVQVALPWGRHPYGQKYQTQYHTDSKQKLATSRGVRINLPSYVLLVEHLLPHPDAREGWWVKALDIWPQKFNGPGITPHQLVCVLSGLVLSHSMQPWELDLYRAGYPRRK